MLDHFSPADGAFGSAEFIALARLDLYENQRVAVPSDQIDFAGSGAGAIVAGDHHDAGAPQVAMRDVFAAAPEGMVGCQAVFAAMMPQSVGELVQKTCIIMRPFGRAGYFTASNSNSITLPRTTKHR